MGNSLGDFFEEEDKELFAERVVKIGTIIRRFETSTTPNKYKFSIVVGESEDKLVVARVLVNSKINPQIYNSIELQNLHIGLDDVDYDCLDHYSYANCSSVKEMNKADLIQEIKSVPDIHKEELNTSDLNAVIETLKKSKTIKPYIKTRYGWI